MGLIKNLYDTIVSTCAFIGGISGLSQFGFKIQTKFYAPFIRILNYHDVSKTDALQFEEQLKYFSKNFVNVDLKELLSFKHGNWPHNKPGLILSFDDGLKSHFEIVAPLLEKHGFTGWFMLPVNFLDSPISAQADFAVKNKILNSDIIKGKRYAMNWSEAKKLSHKHVIGSHTMNHCRLKKPDSKSNYSFEILESKKILQERIGDEISVFCWVGGEKWSYSSEAADFIRKGNYVVSFLTNSKPFKYGDHLHHIQRTNCEAHFNKNKVKLCLSGFFDIRYIFRRKSIDKLIGK